MRSLWPGWDSSGFDREAQSGVLLQDLHSLSRLCTNGAGDGTALQSW